MIIKRVEEELKCNIKSMQTVNENELDKEHNK